MENLQYIFVAILLHRYVHQLSKVVWMFHHCNTFRKYCGKIEVEHKTLQAVFLLTKQHSAYHKWKHLKSCRTAWNVQILAGHLRCLRKPQMNGKRKATSKKLYPNKRRQHYVILHQFLKFQGCAFSLSLKNDFGKDSYFFVIFKKPKPGQKQCTRKHKNRWSVRKVIGQCIHV